MQVINHGFAKHRGDYGKLCCLHSCLSKATTIAARRRKMLSKMDVAPISGIVLDGMVISGRQKVLIKPINMLVISLLKLWSFHLSLSLSFDVSQGCPAFVCLQVHLTSSTISLSFVCFYFILAEHVARTIRIVLISSMIS